MDHAYNLAAASQCLYCHRGQCDLSIVEELPLLETHQYLGIDTLKILVLAGMLEAQLLRLIQYVLPQVVLLAVDPAFRVLVSLGPVLAALPGVFLPRRAHVVVGGIPACVVMLVLLLVDPLEVLPFS